MTRRRPTSREVARRAGVSRSTVSVVLNGVTSVVIAEATRRRVLRAAEELGYVPSAAARQLASGRARTIGLVITYSERLKTDAFVPQALYALNEEAHRHGFRVLVEALEDVTAPDAYHELVRGKQIDGLIVLNPREDDTRLPKLIEDGFPLVVIGHAPTGVTVDVDNTAAARRATEHLLAAGRTRIAHLPYAPLAYHSARMRRDGYASALDAAGVAFDPALVEPADFSAESGMHAMNEVLSRARPDAVFAGNDVVAFGAMTALRAAGLEVPRDVAVVGFDDVPLAAHAAPPLTTVRLPALDLGRRAAERLIRLVEGVDTEPEVGSQDERESTLDMELIVRGSCGAGEGTLGP